MYWEDVNVSVSEIKTVELVLDSVSIFLVKNKIYIHISVTKLGNFSDSSYKLNTFLYYI